MQDQTKTFIDDESEEDDTSSLLEESSAREFEIVLVFRNGDPYRKWNKPSKNDARSQQLFGYLDNWEYYHGMEDEDYIPTEFEAFEGIIQATCFALVECEFHVKRLDAEDLPLDSHAQRKCENFTFVSVGMTERQFRDWAHESKYLLPLEPQILQRWLSSFKDLKLASSLADMQKGRFITWDCFQDLYAPFNLYLPSWIYQTRRNVWKDDPTLAGETVFSTADRIKMIIDKLQASNKTDKVTKGGAGMDLEGLVFNDNHPLHEFFGLHDRYDIRMIKNGGGPFRIRSSGRIKLPLQQLRYYYGEYIGFYFGFMEFSVNHLLLPTFLGILLFIQQSVTDSVNNGFAAAYGVFMIFWAISFPTLWQQQERLLSNFWGQTSFVAGERARPQFKGAIIYSPIDGSLMPYETPRNVRKRRCRTRSIIIFCILILGVNIFFLIMLRKSFEDSSHHSIEETDIYMGFVTAIAILVTNSIYYYVAVWANEYENYRTDKEFENGLIWKSFAFRFVNAYNALFYVTFFKAATTGCAKEAGDESEGCFQELRITLAVIFGALIFWQNITELVPLWINMLDFSRNRPNEVYDQWRLVSYESAFGDLDELIIQFGYICIFVVAFPLAPLLGLASILMEMVIDQYKMSRLVRRPLPRGGQNLGDWVVLLYIIAACSVTVNIAIICFVTNDLNDMVGVDPDNISIRDEIIMFIVAEHLIMVIFALLWAYFTQRMETLSRKHDREQYVQQVLNGHSQDIQHLYEEWETWTAKEVYRWLYALGGEEKHSVAMRFLENRIRGQGLKYLTPDDLRTKLEIRDNGDRVWAWELIVDLRQPSYGDPECMEYLMKARDAGVYLRSLDDLKHRGRIGQDELDARWKRKRPETFEEFVSHLRKVGGKEVNLRFDVYAFGDFLCNSEESILMKLWNQLTNFEDEYDIQAMRDVIFPYVQLYLEHYRITYNESFDEVIKQTIHFMEECWNADRGDDTMMRFDDIAWMGQKLITKGLSQIDNLADSDQWEVTELEMKEIKSAEEDSTEDDLLFGTDGITLGKPGITPV